MEIFLKRLPRGVVDQLTAAAICDVSHLKGRRGGENDFKPAVNKWDFADEGNIGECWVTMIMIFNLHAKTYDGKL